MKKEPTQGKTKTNLEKGDMLKDYEDTEDEMTQEKKLRNKARKNCKGKDYIIFMSDHAVKKGPNPEQTEILFVEIQP